MKLEFKDALGPLVALIAVAAGILQYRSTTNSDFLKPVREAQLKLYQEASDSVARVATLSQESPEWEKSRDDFLRLFYGPLAIVEDFDHSGSEDPERVTVEEAMIAFKSCLDDSTCRGHAPTMQNLSLALAHTCRVSLGKSWGYDVKQLRGDYQKLIRDYKKANGKQ